MKVTPTKGPVIETAQTNTGATEAARARAIAKLTQGAPIPVDQNNISAEEATAVKPTLQSPPKELGQTDTNVATDTPQEAKPAPKEDTASNQYVLLARKEKALRAKAQQQEQAFKAKEAELAAKEAEIKRIQSEYEQGYISKQKLKDRTLEALAEAGVTYDEVTQQQIQAGEINPSVKAHLERLEARLAKQTEELDSLRKGAQEQQTEAYKAAIKQIELDVKTLVKRDPNYETIKATNSTKDVVELIEATYKEEGRVMSVEEAAEEVENYLLDEALKLTRIEKIKKRLNQASAGPNQSNTQPPTQKQPQPMKTLTNATSSQRQLSAKERAILAFKGEKF